MSRPGIKDVEEARLVLEALETKGWIALAEISEGRRGPKHKIYYLHPTPPDKPDKL